MLKIPGLYGLNNIFHSTGKFYSFFYAYNFNTFITENMPLLSQESSVLDTTPTLKVSKFWIRNLKYRDWSIISRQKCQY